MRIPRVVAASALTVAGLALGGCAGVVGLAHGDPGRDAAAPAAAATNPDAAVPATEARQGTDAGPVSAVTAQEAAATDPRLTPDEVAVAVERELQAHHLYEPGSADVRRSLAITVQDFTDSLASNTSVLGFSFRNAVLVATIQVQGAPVPAPPFEVRARARITTRDVGANGGSLADLYTQFAVLTVADLAAHR
jgi:hypothetical protein